MGIPINSRIYICLHEAGHIEAAHLCGAIVREASIDTSGDPRTSVTHKPDLSTKDPVACGGYAVESILFELGELVDNFGTPLSDHAFRVQAMLNARLDKFPFYIKKPYDRERGIYPESPFQPKNGEWPEESDAPFIAYAEEHVVPTLKHRLGVIKAIASALAKHGHLTGDEINRIRATNPGGGDA